MSKNRSERIVITDVPAERLDYYRGWAESLGGKLVSVAQEPDMEFTVVILFP